MTILTFTRDASALARALLEWGAVPEGAEDDAGRIAVAAVDDLDYFLTWNCAHIANTVTMPAIAEVCERQGYSSTVITTPNQLTKVVMTLEDEIMKELRQIRAQIASEHDHDPQKLGAFYQGLRFPGFTYGIPGRTFQTEEELDQYIHETNREFERREARKVASDGMRPPEQH